jgi:hypothetical protein
MIKLKPTYSATTTAKQASEVVEEDSWPIAVLKEGKHYYMEGGFMVFTAAYHSARGRCCGNACRHCPYEHANVRRR